MVFVDDIQRGTFDLAKRIVRSKTIGRTHMAWVNLQGAGPHG
jgi:hypothetical protein